MHPQAFFLFTFLQFGILIPVRILFLGDHEFFSPILQNWLFWAINIVLSVAFIRRIGVLNFMEAFFIFLVWFLGGLFLDLLITSAFVRVPVFIQNTYWYGYLFMLFSIMLFHKKRHIHIRKEMYAKHGHH